ncbi:hypothetical protein ACLQ8Z_09570 [Bordetella hinzii]|jgi:hypothetical protein|nr:hypothetical protein [Bordetella hinzii]AKQ53685.1 hypothetical protein ACR54_00328 [Bordetella hinzii]MCJ9707691.1 hypothetical protein [Bordetella hinzii]QII83545.1 hypothetical protein G3T20_01805 [Bordetella hinzii]QWF40661.1 hypothetical protein HHA25_21545 [Bordetella hinzii]QWF45208.1 hypothetical protein HHA24_21530 [Bordetella hinzii]
MSMVFTLTRRMLTLLVVCLAVVSILLFVLGLQVGSRYAAPPAQAKEAQ